MELLDRYLEAVKKHLPWQRQDDIIAELRANLESQLEEKEGELGRPLTQAEGEAWIKSLGSPVQAAAGYQTQQYLIGPTFFPTYRYVLKLACSWAAVIYIFVNAVQLFVEKDPSVASVAGIIASLPFTLLTTGAWITLVFAALEYAAARGLVNIPAIAGQCPGWQLNNLPKVEQAFGKGKKRRTFVQAVIEAVFSVLSLTWLLLIPHYPFLLMGPGMYYMAASPYALAPVLIEFFWCVVALNAFQVVWNVENLWHDRWRDPQPAMQILFKAFGLIPLIVLFNAPAQAVIVLRHPDLDQMTHGATVDMINLNVHRCLPILGAIVAANLAWDLGRMALDSYRRREAAM
jgi:hypothetical protein